MKAWINASGTEADLANEISAKAQALHSAAARGARFLALPAEHARDTATWILASFRSPVTAVPLPPGLPLPALEARLAQLPAGTVVFPGALALGRPVDSLPPLRALEDLWAVIFTSGSSGEPKGIALTGRSFRESALAHSAHGAGRASWLLDLPLYHVGGLSVLTRALFLESGIALGGDRFDAAHTAAWLASGLVQGLSLVPTTLYRLLELRPDFSGLDLILLGGAPAEMSLLERARAAGAPVRLTYGMTENASQIATERSAGTGLEPLPGVALKISPEGEILFRSPMLAAGQFIGGKLQALPEKGGFFPTGDLGTLLNGKLSVEGRKSELMITGGMKVFPVEIEQAMRRLLNLEDCAAYSVPDPEWGEVVWAAVVEKSTGSFDFAAAKEALRACLEPRKIPRHWKVVARIPRSGAGKILRAELPGLTPIRS